jgi:hypothetical protein
MNKKKTQKLKEVNKLRKTLITVFLVFLSVVLIYGYADAISGPCSSCHTMHNSQDGSSMARDFDNNPLATPQPNLTVSTCLGCHNGQATDAPVIFGDYGSTSLAGGTFNNADFTTDANGHNVKDLVGILTVGLEDTLPATPGAESNGYTVPTPTELTCAGELGCHGNHNVADDTTVTGFHHGAYPDAYRFLRFYDGTDHTDIKGKGAGNYELASTVDAGNHNVYYAMADDSAATNDSISAFCSMCHGGFHGETDTFVASAWIRHPTEVLIPSGWNKASPYDVKVDYDRNPFAFTGIKYDNVSVDLAYGMSDEPRVACISCHRAHATTEDDILRFAYGDMQAGGSNTYGCLGCHTAQRGSP